MKIAACLIVKNEERYVEEWVQYHFAIGFNCLVIYDNESTDQTAKVVSGLSNRGGELRYKLWTDTSPNYQQAAYDDCLKDCGSEFDWIAFIDSDEFLSIASGMQLESFLTRFDAYAAIGINWLIFGSNGHMKAPLGPVVTNYTRRSEVSFGPNRHIKSIVRPMCTTRCLNPHVFEVVGDYAMVDGSKVEWDIPGLPLNQPVIDPVRINHYFVRSREDWMRKLKRGYHDTVRLEEQFHSYDRNEVDDQQASRFVLHKFPDLNSLASSSNLD